MSQPSETKAPCRACHQLTCHDIRCRLAKGLDSPVLDSERLAEPSPRECTNSWMALIDLQPQGKEPQGCTECGHNNINARGECRQCIDWQKHVCTFPPQERSDGWLPIESAPKDGTPVMLFSPCDPFFNDGANVGTGMVWVSGGWRDTGGWRGDYGHDEPTHWQPLPDPPKEMK